MDYILPGFNKTNTTVINQQNGSPAKNSDSEDDTAEIFKKMFGTYN
jgi:hypothetical protein